MQTMATMTFDPGMSYVGHQQYSTSSSQQTFTFAGCDCDMDSSMCYTRPVDSRRQYAYTAIDTDDLQFTSFPDFQSQDIGSLLQDLNHPDFMTLLDECTCLDESTTGPYAGDGGASCGVVARNNLHGMDMEVVKTEACDDVIEVTPTLDENGNYCKCNESPTSTGDPDRGPALEEGARSGWINQSMPWMCYGVDPWRPSSERLSSDSTPFSSSKTERPDSRVQRAHYVSRPAGGSSSTRYLSSPDNSLSSRPSSATPSCDPEVCDVASSSCESLPTESYRPLSCRSAVDNASLTPATAIGPPRCQRAPSTGSRRRRSVCLWQFLRELLYSEQHSCRPPIRWLDRDKGIFKIEDSMLVAKMWGQRKNRPAMNYDKLSRSIRQYYKHGIIQKTTKSRRLVFQFCPQYI